MGILSSSSYQVRLEVVLRHLSLSSYNDRIDDVLPYQD